MAATFNFTTVLLYLFGSCIFLSQLSWFWHRLLFWFMDVQKKSRHMVMCCVAQEAAQHTVQVERKRNFHTIETQPLQAASIYLLTCSTLSCENGDCQPEFKVINSTDSTPCVIGQKVDYIAYCKVYFIATVCIFSSVVCSGYSY